MKHNNIVSKYTLGDLVYAHKFLEHFGTNYSLGVRLLPKESRESTTLLYAFVRYADEIIDNPELDFFGKQHSSLQEFEDDWDKVMIYGVNDNTHPIFRGMYTVAKKHSIPLQYTVDFLAAMKQDITQKRYHSYQDLESYMYGSAVVVGYMMSCILGYEGEHALPHARSLGEAMQLANFLRDIDDDYRTRDRIYLPQQTMALWGVHESDIEKRIMSEQLQAYVKFYVDRADELFNHGIEGIKYLSTGRLSVLIASNIYRHHLTILRKNNYNIFSGKVKISKTRKFIILIKTLFSYFFTKKVS